MKKIIQLWYTLILNGTQAAITEELRFTKITCNLFCGKWLDGTHEVSSKIRDVKSIFSWWKTDAINSCGRGFGRFETSENTSGAVRLDPSRFALANTAVSLRPTF